MAKLSLITCPHCLGKQYTEAGTKCEICDICNGVGVILKETKGEKNDRVSRMSKLQERRNYENS